MTVPVLKQWHLTVAPGCMGSAADSLCTLRQARSVPFEGK